MDRMPDAHVNATDVSVVARHLFQTQGGRAIAEAAQKAVSCTQAGDREQAKFWQRVEAVLVEMQGPHQG